MHLLRGPRYYDAPEGEAGMDKVMATSRKALVFALFAGVTDCVWITDTRNALQTINCMAYWIVPAVGMGATWASVTYMSTRIRGKDDVWNYMAGAAACMPILRAWTRTKTAALVSTALLVGTAMVAKEKSESGWPLVGDAKQKRGFYELDMSMQKDHDKDFRSPYQHWM